MQWYCAILLVCVAFWAGRKCGGRSAANLLVDAAATVNDLVARVRPLFRLLFDRCYDFSSHSIVLPGQGTFYVTWAATAVEKRAVTWLYQAFDTPDELDWQECLTKYKLAKVPTHTLKWISNRGVCTTAAVTIDLVAARYSVLRTRGTGEITSVDGDIAIGALTPGNLFGCR